MFRRSGQSAILCSLLMATFAWRAAGESENADETFCHDYFGKTALHTPLALADTNFVVWAVSQDGEPSGWIFRTDQVPPACKGKRGQIAVLVGIGTDARIKGLTVLSHKEDSKYFRRLNTSFFSQFRDKRADETAASLDAVTHATYSSRAIIRDVMEGAKNVISLPEVAALLGARNKGG